MDALNSASDLAAEAHYVRLSLSAGRSVRLVRLLDYLLECTASDSAPSERDIACAVLGSKAAADAQPDSSARVYVYRLRRKLDQLYRDRPGPRLHIPLGQYRLLLIDPAQDDPSRNPLLRHTPARAKFRTWCMVAALLLNAVGWGFLLQGEQKQQPALNLAATQIWRPLAMSDRPTTIIFGDHYLFADASEAMAGAAPATRLIHDPAITSRDDLDLFLMEHPQHIGQWRDVNQTYAPSNTIIALQTILTAMRGLKATGAARANVLPASRLSPDMLKSSNIVYVGLFSGLSPLLRNPLFLASGFQVGANYAELIDQGTGQHYTSKDMLETADTALRRDYGYIARLPGPNGNHLLIIAGTNEQALIQMADMASRPSPPVSRNRGIQTSPAFEALYRVDSAGGIRLGQRLVVTRPLRTEGVWDTSLPSQRFPNDFAIRSGEPMRGDVRKVAGPIM